MLPGAVPVPPVCGSATDFSIIRGLALFCADDDAAKNVSIAAASEINPSGFIITISHAR